MSGFALKTYQSTALDALRLFLQQASTMGLEAAWAHAMNRQGADKAPAYRSEELGEVPCVCLRIPTGGGKTLLASHAIPLIASQPCAGVQREFPLALWLVPSDMIRSQTLGALQTPGHPYRAALEAAYGSLFQVCELDALHTLPPQCFGQQTVVVVATIQSLRISNKAGRKAYAMSEAWEPHFKTLNLTPQQVAALGLATVTQQDVDEEGQAVLTSADVGRVKHSLANWLALQRPIVIVDEAHNTKTPLSLAMLRDIRPCCVLDLTATPVPGKTNVLVAVSARELQAEEMIKLPIMLAEHETGWADAVRDALLRRKQLEAEAAHEPQYVRPIVLFQAQDQGSEVTVEVLKKHLVSEHGIAEAEIAVATGSQRGLDGVNLFDRGCPVRYVITVDALKEGWDCSFAYVLCSVQNLRSNQAVEQLLGRVLRMPYAKRRQSPALNRAYAHVVAASFAEAANSLVDKMVSGMGFDALSAASVLLPDAEDLSGSLFEASNAGAFAQPSEPVFELRLDAAATGVSLATVQAALAQQPDVQVSEQNGAVVLQAKGALSDQLQAQVLAAVPPKVRAEAEQSLAQHAARVQAALAPAERGVAFAPLPQLCLRFGTGVGGQGELELIERETLAELTAFDLLHQDPQPTLPGFDLVEQVDLFEIYLDGAKVQIKQAHDAQLSLNAVPSNASEADLVMHLVAQLRLPNFTQNELLVYVQKVVTDLLRVRGFTLTGLVRSRFQLAQAIERRIESQTAEARSAAFQALLFDRLESEAAGGKTALAVSQDWQFHFKPNRYPVRNAYRGRWQFSKHYYPEVADLKAEGEEFECAQALDREPAVKHWVRNIERQPQFAFWLPTATDYFYPDFVAELQGGGLEGRLLVVEYKGGQLASNDDSAEKRLLGERWAHTAGQGFVMVEKVKNGQSMAQQIRAAVDALRAKA